MKIQEKILSIVLVSVVAFALVANVACVKKTEDVKKDAVTANATVTKNAVEMKHCNGKDGCPKCPKKK